MRTFGTVTSVEARTLGSELLADAAIGATVLSVDFTGDFDEAGGTLLLGPNTLAYTGVDPEAHTITLAAPLAAAAVADDTVKSITAGKTGVEWTANVSVDEGDTVAAVIPTALVRYFTEGTYDDPVTVEVALVGDEYHVQTQPAREAILDGAGVWNPYSFRDMNALSVPDNTFTQVTSWSDSGTDGVTTGSGYTVQYPGAYALTCQVAFAADPTGRRAVRIMVNGSQVAYGANNADTTAGASTFTTTTAALVLSQLDEITVEVYQSSGATLALSFGAGRCFFTMYRVSI